MLIEAFRDGDPRRRAAWSFVLTLVYALGFALLSISLELPYFGQGRAPYALGLLGPLSVAFALGAATCDDWLARRRWNALRVVGGGWLAMLALVLFLGFAG